MRQPTDHGVPHQALAAAATTPPIRLHDPARQHRPAGFEPLPDNLQTEFVEPAERGQVGTIEGTVGHVEVFRLGGVRTPMIGRPRPTARHRRAVTPTPSNRKSQFGFIWRQPRNDAETLALMIGCSSDPLSGFNWNGDQHWTPDLVRKWWARRDARSMKETDAVLLAAASGRQDQAAAYLAYLASDDIEHDLRRYLFFLAEGQYPTTQHLPYL